MFIYYVLLLLSATIFSFQFLITKIYQKKVGTGINGSIVLSCFAYFFIAVIFYFKGCIERGDFRFDYSPFTFMISICTAISAFTCLYLSIKVLYFGDMGVYSTCMMLGSIVLHALTGIVFYGEKITALKVVALALTFCAVALSLDSSSKGKLNFKSLLCYLGFFCFNGMVGVLLTIHQNHPELTAGVRNIGNGYEIDGNAFMSWIGISQVIVSIVILLFLNIKRVIDSKGNGVELIEKSKIKIDLKTVLFVVVISLIYGLCNGFGDYFITLATMPGALGSSVTFPMIDGGTILISGLIGIFILKEKLSVKKIVSFVMVTASTLMFMFV